MAHGSSCTRAPDRPPRPPQVRLTDAGHRAPVNLLARIEQGLTDVLDGDIGYGGRITKNPTHTTHMPLWGEAEALRRAPRLFSRQKVTSYWLLN